VIFPEMVIPKFALTVIGDQASEKTTKKQGIKLTAEG